MPPPGEARPGWKILRVLGNVLGLGGFDYGSADEVRGAVPKAVTPSNALTEWRLPAPGKPETGLQRIAERPMYRVDPLVRRAAALLKTKDNPPPAVRMNAAQADKLKLRAGASVSVRAGKSEVRLELTLDARVPDNCVWIPSGYAETAALGGHNTVSVQGAGA